MTYNELCESILTAKEEMLKCTIDANSVTLNGRKYGKLIENCPPNMKPTIFGMSVKTDYSMPDDYDFIMQRESPQPITNQEAMCKLPPEEFYKKMHWLLFSYGCQFNSTELAVIDWLKQEVKEDER